MPHLLIDKKKKRTVKRSSKSTKVTFVLPHSPFQKLVEAARVEKHLSYAQLGKLIGANAGSVWIWIHSPNGYPHPKSCTTARLKRISDVLRVPLPRLQESLDASRHLFTQRERPASSASIDSWQEFVNWLENDKRETLRKKTVLNMARRFQAAANSAGAE